MADVINLHPAIDPDVVLTNSLGTYSEVIVLGWTKDNDMQARSTLGLEVGDILLLVELFKKMLIEEISE